MNKIYIVDGVQYNVAPNREEEFLKEFPTATLEEQVEKQEATEETANFVAEDEAALKSMNTDLTSDNVLSDYDSEVKKINLSYDEEISNIDVTESDKELYSSFVVDENVIETKTKQLNEQRLKDLALAEQKRDDKQLLSDSKNPETSSGRGIHDWLDNESTTETFKSEDYGATADALKTMYRDYDFKVNSSGGYDLGTLLFGSTDLSITMTAPNGNEKVLKPLQGQGMSAFGFEPKSNTTQFKSDIIEFIDNNGYDAKLYDQVDKEISEETKRINSIVNVTDTEAAEIEKETESIDLFESYTKEVGDFVDTGNYMMETTKQVVVNPHKKELDAAEKMLNDARAIANKKRSIDDQLPAATEDEIKNTARKILYNDKYNQLQDDKWTDYLEENDDEMQGILKAYKAVEEDKSFKTAAGLQKLQEVELADYNSSASEGDRVIVEDFEKIYIDGTKQFVVEEGQETMKLRNGKIVPKEAFNKYLTSSKNLRDKYARLQDRQSRIDTETDNLKSIDAQFDLLRRDYNTWSKFQYNVGSGFASIGGGIAYGVGKVIQGAVYVTGSGPQSDMASDAVGDFLDETATKFTDWKNMSRDQYAKDVSFDRAFTSGPAAFGRFMTQEMGQQLPILATIIASGGTASPYIIGAYAAGEKYMEMDQEDLRSGFERNEAVKFGVSAGYGAAEAVFESLTTVQILKRGNNYLRAAGGESLLTFRNAMKRTWQEQGVKTLLFPFADAALESVGEGLTQMTQNMLDGVGLLDNVDHAMFSGGMFGFGMSVSPVMYGMALKALADPKKYDEYNNAIKDIASVNNLLKNDLISEKSRDILRKKKIELERKSKKILQETVGTVEDNLDSKGWKEFNKTTRYQQEQKQEAEAILNDPALSESKKQELLKSLKARFDSNQNLRNLYRSNKLGNNFELLKSTNNEEYESIIAEAEEKIRKDKNENPNFTPDINEVQNVAFDIYAEQTIINQVAAAQNSYGVDIKLAKTNKEAIEIVNNATNLSDQAKKDIIRDIKDGTLNGLDNINGQEFVILENSVKNGRTSIGVHEPGHKVFEKILGTEEGDFSQLTVSIVDYLSKTDPDMLAIIQDNMSGSKIDRVQQEEFVIEFLEQVDRGNIDFKQKKNRKLASLFGFMTNNITSKKGFEVNFKGETDAVNFLIGLAKKISSGTLTKQDVADARSSEALAPTVLAAINSVVSKGPKKKKVKTSKEQDDRNVKYRDIFNNRFTVVDPDDSEKRIPISQQEYLNYMLVDGIKLKDGGTLTPEGAQLFEDVSRDWIDQVMQLSSFDAELAMTTITGPFLNHLLAMNPEIQMTAKNPIAAYMGNYAPFKVGDARKQMAKGASPSNSLEIDAQVEGRKQFDPVAAEEVNIPEELNFTRQSGVLPGSDMYNAILRANELVLGTKLPKLEYTRKKKGQPDVVVNLKDVRAILKNKDSISRQEFQQAELDYTRIIKDFRNNIAAQYESILYDNIKESLGKGTAGYDQRLLDLKNAMVEKLSVSDLVAMERLSKDKIFTRLDRTNLNVNEISAYEGTGRLVYSNPKSGPNLYSRLNPSDQAFVDFFKKRGRDEALIKNLAKTYGFDGTMQVMTEQDTIDKITNRNPELNYLVADDVIQVMASAIDRGVQSKLSKEVERQFSEIKNPTANNFGIYMEDKDRLIKLLLDTGYNVGFSNKIKDTKIQVRSIIESLYADKLSGPEITKLVNLYSPLINKFGKQIAEYEGITDFPLKSYIDGSLNADENTTLNKFWNLKSIDPETGKEIDVNIGDLYDADGRDHQKSFINVSIPQLIKAYKKQEKTKLDLAIDFILFKGGFEDGGLDRNMIYGNEASGIYDTKKEAEAAIKALEELKGYKIKESKITYQEEGKYQGKYRVGGGHVEVFNKELLEENFGITSYKSKTTKDGVTTWTLEVVENGETVTREVIGPKSYPQKTTMDMVNNNMSQQEIDGRNDYSDRAWNFVTTYYKTVDKMLGTTATKQNAAMLMKGFNDNMKGPMRAAGRLTYVPTNIDTKGYNSKNVGKLFEYEHGIPSSVMNLMIADAVFGKNKEISLSKLKDSYQVGVITKGFDDNFGNFFKASMPLTYQYGDNPLTRWFNEFTIGGEVTELFNIQTGKIVKESIAPAKLWNSVKQAKAANVTNLSNNVVKTSMESYEDLNFKTDEGGNMSAKFKVGNKNYNIDFYPVDIEDTAYVIEFDQDNKQGITGSGNAFETMGIVYNSLTSLIKNNPNVETVEFSALAKDKSRVRLYNTMLKKLGADLGWETDIYTVEIFGKLSGYDYELTRPEGQVSTPVKASMETNEDIVNYAATVDAALNNARKLNAPVKKIRIFDFDDTLARSNSKVFAIKNGERIEMSAEEFASNGAQMLTDGYTFDFTDFNIVRDGKPGPLLDIAKKIQAARGTEDVFVLTARAPESQGPIKKFLDSVGLNIPLSNITGLGNSTGAAKAKWVVEKAAEGYNDFYFADDAYQNVKAVRDAMSVLDVKSKVQQAKMSLESDINEDFNNIIEEATGIRSESRYSEAKGKIVGAKKGRFKFFIPYSAEDFLGLIYPILPKGAKGNSAMKWFKERLMDPYTRAANNLSTFRKNMFEDFKKLKEDLDVPKDLKKTNESGFSNEQAVRVYIWTKQGMSVPGLSKGDTKELLDIIEANQNLKTFADEIMKLNKTFEYNAPSEGWLAGTITTDLIDGVNKNVRRKYLEEWQANVDVVFSQENLNKLEAAYGTKYVEALKNVLERMKQGKNRLATGNRLSNRILDYINNANGVVMFLNIRSAVLQTLSSANFINWSFNNPIQAGKAFANQKQYWSDFMMLMNSDFLVDRRNGMRINISENEIANAANTSGNKAQAAISYILSKGYAPTQFADSFAIALGGATYFRNRSADLMKNNPEMTQKEADAQAMLEFREKAEESQQSSDPMRISQQQSSDAGRLILAYANTPMQYARMQKRAFQDLAAGRGDNKANVSKIIYYGVVQNLMFNMLQQAVFALAFNSEDDEEKENKKAIGVANGMADSILRGLGMGGAAVAVMKNFLLDIYERSGRKRPEYVDSIYKLLQFSPPISSKISKLRQAAWQMDSKKRRKKAMEDFGLDNPGYEAGTKVISAVTNVPLDRLLLKMQNIEAAIDEETEWWQSVAMLAGWPEWQINPDAKGSDGKKKPIKIKTLEEKLKEQSNMKSF